jgi:hypothetical protein
MFSAGITFFPGSPQSLMNIQAMPIPRIFELPIVDDGSGPGNILDTGDQPILNTEDNPIPEA